MSDVDLEAVRNYLIGLQGEICSALEREDGAARFSSERLETPTGLALPRVLADGVVVEKAAVNFSASRGPALPPAATERRPELAGRSFEAASLSLIVHPRNPYAPTTHCNLRCFVARRDDEIPVWWFGGGFDLTPYYGFTDDAVHWHRVAQEACAPHGDDLYGRLKRNCDEYFYLPHRGEARGVGGLFYDDFDEGGFERCFALTRSIGDHFVPAYLPILQRRHALPYADRERDFQLLRRGRYAEFNLVVDRGTRYGLQSGRRIESVLASLPPLAAWRYNWQAEPASPEERLVEDFLQPRDWLAEASGDTD